MWSLPQVYGQEFAPSARWGHTATKMRDDRLLIMGGWDGNAMLNDAYVLDLNTKVWSKPLLGGTIPLGRGGHSLTLLPSYTPATPDQMTSSASGDNTPASSVSTGRKNSTSSNSSTGSSANNNNVSKRRDGFSADNTLVLFGGGDGSDYLQDVYFLNGDTMKWSKPNVNGTPPAPRSRHTANLISDNKLFIFGGGSSSKIFGDSFVFNAATLTWTESDAKGSPPPARWGHTTTHIRSHLQNAMYVFGGVQGSMMLNDLYKLDIDNYEWIKINVDCLPDPRAGHTTTAFGNSLFVLWGGDDTKFLNDLYIVDTENFEVKYNTFSTPTSRCAHTATFIDGKIYVFGGGDGVRRFKELYALDPIKAVKRAKFKNVSKQTPTSISTKIRRNIISFNQQRLTEEKKQTETAESRGVSTSHENSTSKLSNVESTDNTSKHSSGSVDISNNITNNANNNVEIPERRGADRNSMAQGYQHHDAPSNNTITQGTNPGSHTATVTEISHISEKDIRLADTALSRIKQPTTTENSISDANTSNNVTLNTHNNTANTYVNNSNNAPVNVNNTNASGPTKRNSFTKSTPKIIPSQQYIVNNMPSNLNNPSITSPINGANYYKTFDDIVTWLEGLGLGRYAPIFVREEIDMSALPLLNETDLFRMGIPTGPRKKILHGIHGLQVDHNSNTKDSAILANNFVSNSTPNLMSTNIPEISMLQQSLSSLTVSMNHITDVLKSISVSLIHNQAQAQAHKIYSHGHIGHIDDYKDYPHHPPPQFYQYPPPTQVGGLNGCISVGGRQPIPIPPPHNNNNNSNNISNNNINNSMSETHPFVESPNSTNSRGGANIK